DGTDDEAEEAAHRLEAVIGDQSAESVLARDDADQSPIYSPRRIAVNIIVIHDPSTKYLHGHPRNQVISTERLLTDVYLDGLRMMQFGVDRGEGNNAAFLGASMRQTQGMLLKGHLKRTLPVKTVTNNRLVPGIGT
ncbi:uncharacterized protein TRIREDRAFT_108003, partial [Trichoderma reesei QM6a]